MSQAVCEARMLGPSLLSRLPETVRRPALQAIIARHLDGLLSDDPMGYLRGLLN
jgi:hypothetical protein